MPDKCPNSFPRFAVLLAAYNGRKWFSAQLQSILDQENVHVTVFVSVDSSSDGTESLVDEWARIDSRVVPLPYGEIFGGAAKNFYHILCYVDFSKYDYVSLADQDDIWLLDKLISAHVHISSGCFAAYSGSVTAFWPSGREILLNKAQPQRRYDFLFEAAGPGCSYVLTVQTALLFKAFLLENREEANTISLHDWLIYAWYRANGFLWFIDCNPKIWYRQHLNNQVGANSGFSAFIARLRLIYKGWYRSQTLRIIHLLGESAVGYDIVQDGKLSKWLLLRNINQLRRRLRDRVFLCALILLGFY